MRKLLIYTMTLLATQTAFSMAKLCNDPLRNQQICRKMRHLRSQVNLLEAQRDLLQVNYSYTGELAKDMKKLTDDLYTNHNSDGNLDAIKVISHKASNVIEYANLKDAKMLYAANQVHRQCTICHSTREPKSGYSWDHISKLTWGDINLKCNEESIGIRAKETSDGLVWEGVIESKIKSTRLGERNPYRCKSMHGMFNVLEYFITGNQAEELNYEMTSQAASEVIRISTDLKNKNMYHGGDVMFENVKRMAEELKRLSKEKNPLVRYKRQELAVACLQCHKDGPNPEASRSNVNTALHNSLFTNI